LNSLQELVELTAVVEFTPTKCRCVEFIGEGSGLTPEVVALTTDIGRVYTRGGGPCCDQVGCIVRVQGTRA